MWISRLRVTGGFLADLDVPFAPGLNVVVGPRGAGKTTLLELIRHALGLRHADPARARRQEAILAFTLGDGEVVLDVETDEGSLTVMVDAHGNGQVSQLAGAALMVGQNELESIASDPRSRLNLLDLRADLSNSASEIDHIARLTADLATQRARATQLRDRLQIVPSLRRDLAEVLTQEQALLSSSSAETANQRALLSELESLLVNAQRRETQLGGYNSRLSATIALADRLHVALEGLVLEDDVVWPDEGGTSLRTTLAKISDASGDLREKMTQVSREMGLTMDSSVDIRRKMAPLRSALEEAERGLGDVTTRARNLRSQLASLTQVDAELELVDSIKQRMALERDVAFDLQETESSERFESRVRVAESASHQLGGRVTIAVEHLADQSSFRDFLIEELQGSGLKYTALADTLAGALLPRQLLNLIEDQAYSALAGAASIAEDRAARVCAHLDTPDTLARLSQVVLDDRADFLLTDGSTRKSVETLSTGQKCAVTLPILLTEQDRTLIMDQPEDHLDNAYLVANIVASINLRSNHAVQTIVATHNPNIPVLGSADSVVSLLSDGRRGYMNAHGPFDADDVVRIITSLMEGGREAFERRANFYREHPVG